MDTDELIAALTAHRTRDAEEQSHRDNIIAFVSSHAGNWWKRTTLEGHVTASAWIVNAAGTHALLLHHAKLNRWVQPGGHIDDTDASPASAAIREAREETGLVALAFGSSRLFDVDVHPIPARGNEPGHFHYDLRYLVIAAGDAVSISVESLDARWLEMEKLPGAEFERSISRMAEKILSRADPG